MSNKRFGLAKEREAKKQLEADGWNVIRSRGSFGFYDLCCMHPKLGWKLIQVKATHQKYMSYGAEIEKICWHKVPPNTQKE